VAWEVKILSDENGRISLILASSRGPCKSLDLRHVAYSGRFYKASQLFMFSAL